MTRILFLVISFASISVLGTPQVQTSEKIVIRYATSRPVAEVVTRYVTEEFNFRVDLDYDIQSRKERLTRLPIFQGYESDLRYQLLRENVKLDRLMSDNSDKKNARENKRAMKREIKKQKALIIDLISKSESLNDYIAWLRS